MAEKLNFLGLQHQAATEDIEGDIQGFIREGGDAIQSLRAVGLGSRQLELLVRETMEDNARKIRQEIAVAMERVLELRRLHPGVERLGLPIFNIPLV